MAYVFKKYGSISGGGGSTLPPIMLNEGGTVDNLVVTLTEYVNAITEYGQTGRMFAFCDGDAICAVTGMAGATFTSYFLNASKNKLITLGMDNSGNLVASYVDFGGGSMTPVVIDASSSFEEISQAAIDYQENGIPALWLEGREICSLIGADLAANEFYFFKKSTAQVVTVKLNLSTYSVAISYTDFATKSYVDSLFGAYITDIDNLVGGGS